MMTYQAALDYIHSANRFGIKLGLENTARLLAELESPQDRLKFIHIAGTNGKGSTASFIAHALMAAGYRVGRYISPFIELFNERIQIDNDYIADDDLARYTARVKAAVERLSALGIQPTEFEIVTAIGLLYFAEQAVDVVVLEVGMGGRFDSTNVIKEPLATVITPVSLDHMAYLGDTVAEIAAEKAGIIKPGCLVISSQSNQSAAAVIKEVAAERAAPYIVSDWRSASAVNFMPTKTAFRYHNVDYVIQLLGDYQVQNACAAIDTLLALDRAKLLSVSQDAINEGLRLAKWRGRFEVINECPPLLIDGAHNVAAIERFVTSLNHYYSKTERIAIFGIMADKAVDQIVPLIVDQFSEFYLIEPPNPRAMPVLELSKMLRLHGFAGKIVIDQSLDQISAMINNDQRNIVYAAFGSLYFIGELRKKFLK